MQTFPILFAYVMLIVMGSLTLFAAINTFKFVKYER